jgi:hypothetical protein
MILFLVCIAAAYAAGAVYQVSQNSATSKLKASLGCPATWNSLFVLTAVLMFFTDSIGLCLALGAVMGVLGLAAWFTRAHDAQYYGSPQPHSRPVALLNSTYPLLVIALLVTWHVFNSNDPNSHPVAQKAKKRQVEIEDSRRMMEIKLVTMYRYLDEFDVPLTDNTYSWEQIRVMAEDLIELADDLIEDYDSLTKHRDEFIDQLIDAPEIFRHAGQIWRQYAMEEQAVGATQVAQEYLANAELWEAYARKAESMQADSCSLRELGEVIFFIGRVRLYLTRLLANSPLSTGVTFLDEKTKFESGVRDFIAKFDDLRKEIRGLTNQLNAEDEPPHYIDYHKDSLPENALALEDLRSTGPQGIPRLIREIAASAD